MGNRLFQEAWKAVNAVKHADSDSRTEAIKIAKNALSSAYANSTIAEKEQLRTYQDELNSIERS